MTSSAPTGGAVIRRQPVTAVWGGFVSSLPNASGPPGSVQPRATAPAPRRAATRALWRGHAAVTAANLTTPAGQQPHGFTSSRRPVGALWGGSYTPQANASVPPGSVQPHLTIARRSAARAVQHGTITGTTNGAPPSPVSGSIQPRATAPAPRRSTERVIWRGGAVPGIAPQPATGGLIRRRNAARSLWRGGAGAPPPASAPGIPATGGRVVTRRPPNRGQWHGSLTSTTNALPVAVPAPRQSLTVPRRTASRVLWRGVTPVTSNAPPAPPGALFSAGSARWTWAAGGAQWKWTSGGARNG